MKWRTFEGIIKLEISGLELGRRSKGLKRHFALWWCCDACSCHDISWVAAGCRNTTITIFSCYRLVPLLCSSVFIVLVLYISVPFVSLCFLFYFLCNSRFVILSSSFLSSSSSGCCFCFLFIAFFMRPSDLLSCFCLRFYFIHVYSFCLPVVPLLCSLLPFSQS